MSNENYLNYYIETMTSTLTDVIVRNVSLQATNRLHEDTIKEYEKTVEALDAEIGRLNQSGSDTVTELQLEIARLNDELNSIRNLKSEYENVKTQVQHVDTFRNELLKARKENEELQEQIQYLQMTPAKRKKYDELKSQEVSSTNVRDGGSF
jgi:archaellum component FlaC